MRYQQLLGGPAQSRHALRAVEAVVICTEFAELVMTVHKYTIAPAFVMAQSGIFEHGHVSDIWRSFSIADHRMFSRGTGSIRTFV